MLICLYSKPSHIGALVPPKCQTMSDGPEREGVTNPMTPKPDSKKDDGSGKGEACEGLPDNQNARDKKRPEPGTSIVNVPNKVMYGFTTSRV